MPDRGFLQRTAAYAPPVQLHAEGASWRLAGARLAQVTFEVSRDAALALMPCDVSRPVPCYARLVVLDAPAAPVGPFKLAALHVGGRFRLMPRNMLVDGVIEGPWERLAEALGGPYRAGAVTLGRSARSIEASVSDMDGELASLSLPELSAIDRSMLRWDPWLALASIDGVVQLVESAIRPAAREAFLSKGARVRVSTALPRAHLWRTLRNLNTISACHIEGDIEILLPRPQEPLP